MFLPGEVDRDRVWSKEGIRWSEKVRDMLLIRTWKMVRLRPASLKSESIERYILCLVLIGV